MARASSPKPPVEKIDYFNWNAPRSVSIYGTKYVLIDHYVKWVPVLYRDRNFAAIEKHITSLLSEENEQNANELHMLYFTLGNISDMSHADLMAKVLDKWCRTSTSESPWIVRGYFHINYGWAIRGYKWASQVPPKDMRRFMEEVKRAKDDFENAYAINPDDPNSCCGLLTVARALSLPEEAMETYFQEGIQVSPGLSTLYSQKLEYLKPKWHGSREKMVAFAKECAGLGDAYPSVGLVAVNALREIQNFMSPKGINFFGEAANWELVQKSYERVFAKFPDNLLKHFDYAHDALLAKRYQTAIEQFDLIGGRWQLGTAWDSLKSFNRGRSSAYHDRGVEIYKRKLFRVAEGYFLQATRYLPSGRNYYDLANAEWMDARTVDSLQLWLKAEASLEKAVRLDPKLPGARNDLKTLKKYLAKNYHTE